MRTHFVAALLALASLPLASGCGAGDPESPASASPKSDKAEFLRAREKFAECMRQNGIDFPKSEDGPVRIGGGSSPGQLREAEENCAKLREAIRPPELSDEQKQEFKEAALEHARCMREQGIDFPDPEFGEDGSARIRLGRGDVDPDDPDLRAAQEECSGTLDGIMRELP